MERWEVGGTTWPHGTASKSLDAFLHHPLAVIAPNIMDDSGEAVRWVCNTHIPGATEFSFMVRPGLDHCINYWTPALKWMERRGIEPQTRQNAVMSIKHREIYHVDIVGERKGGLCLILMYCPPTPRPDWAPTMLEHARRVKAVCKEQYALEPEVALLRLSASGRSVRGQFV